MNIQEIFKNGGGAMIEPPKTEDAIYNAIFGTEIGVEPINWELYLPDISESQAAIPFCVTFSRLNAAETMAHKLGMELNLSDRYLGVKSGTTKTGNGLNTVSETFRKVGVVAEDICPFESRMLSDPYTYWNQTFKLPPIPDDAYIYKGGNHSWVYGKEAMKNALAYSPLQVAIGVPSTYNDPIIKDTGKYYAYHAIMVYKIDEAGNYYIYDSIPPFKKVLDKDFNIMQCKSFKDLPENWKQLPTYTLTTEMARYVWLLREDLRKEFPASTKFYSINDSTYTLYDWCRIYGPKEMPEVFVENKLNWELVTMTSDAKKIKVETKNWLDIIINLIKKWIY